MNNNTYISLTNNNDLLSTNDIIKHNMKYGGCSGIQPLLIAARWHYFTFLDAWIQADVVKPRDHSLTNQRSTCILQPLTTPKCSLCRSLSKSFVLFLLLLHFLSLSSFTKCKPSLLLLLLSLSNPFQTCPLCPFPATPSSL